MSHLLIYVCWTNLYFRDKSHLIMMYDPFTVLSRVFLPLKILAYNFLFFIVSLHALVWEKWGSLKVSLDVPLSSIFTESVEKNWCQFLVEWCWCLVEFQFHQWSSLVLSLSLFERFLTTALMTFFIGLFRFSVSLQFSLVRLIVSRNLSISSRLSTF